MAGSAKSTTSNSPSPASVLLSHSISDSTPPPPLVSGESGESVTSSLTVTSFSTGGGTRGSAVQLGNKREHFGVDNKQIETTPACIRDTRAVAHTETPLLKSLKYRV